MVIFNLLSFYIITFLTSFVSSGGIIQVSPVPDSSGVIFDEPFSREIGLNHFFSPNESVILSVDGPEWLTAQLNPPKVVNSFQLVGNPEIYYFKIRTGILFITTRGSPYLFIVNCSDVTRCEVLRKINTGLSWTYDVFVNDDFIAVSGNVGVKLYNYTSLDYQVTLLSEMIYASSFNGWKVEIRKNLMYSSAYYAVRIFNISNPKYPTIINDIALKRDPRDFVIKRHNSTRDIFFLAMFTDNYGLRSYSVDNNDISSYRSGDDGFPSVRLIYREEDETIFIADHAAGYRSVSVADPFNLTRLSSFKPFDASTFYSHDICFGNDEKTWVFATDWGINNGALLINYTDPSNPQVIHTFPFAAGHNFRAFALRRDRNWYYYGNEKGHMEIVEMGSVVLNGTPKWNEFDGDCKPQRVNVTASTYSGATITTSFYIHFNRTGYYGDGCDIPSCFDKRMEEDICSNHGECASPNNCSCDKGYTSQDCSDWECFGHHYDEFPCTGHGVCVSYNNCSCSSAYDSAEDCSKWECYHIPLGEDNVCGGHGTCIGVDECRCDYGYFSSKYVGHECDSWACDAIRVIKNESVSQYICNGRGVCVSADLCSCNAGFSGSLCEKWSCHGLENDDSFICSGNGKCLSPDDCECETPFSGEKCEDNMLYYTVMTPILSLFCIGTVFVVGCIFCVVLCCSFFCCFFLIVLFLFVLFIVCFAAGFVLCLFLGLCCFITCCLKYRMKKFGKLRNFDILLKEQQLEDDESVAHVRINKQMFEIPMGEIELIKVLGEGGSHSVVYRAEWRNQEVAFKCFKTRAVCGNQEKFDEFETEVSVLASISHPHIIRYFGSSLQPPRVGIVMEFCENGDLDVFLQRFIAQNEESYPFDQKMRLIIETTRALEYLHSRSIIHRDLKLENVLVDSKESAKLMDFGLSRIVDRMSRAKTSRIGTSYYMSPEIVNSGHYDEKTDVFSLSIMMYIVLSDVFRDPFGADVAHVELQVASKPLFRPDLEVLRSDKKVPLEHQEWILEIIVACWDHDPEKRMSMSEICEKIEEKIEIVPADFSWRKKKDKKKKKKKKEKVVVTEEEDGEEEEEEKQFVHISKLKEMEEVNLGLRKEIEELKKENDESAKLKEEVILEQRTEIEELKKKVREMSEKEVDT